MKYAVVIEKGPTSFGATYPTCQGASQSLIPARKSSD